MRPFKEVILFDNVTNGQYNDGLRVQPTTAYKLKQSGTQVIWSGSVEKFKNDFEIPEDAPLSTKETGLTTAGGANGDFVTNWNWTTLNFKFNYQVWFRDSHGSNNDNFYVNGSNNSIDLTIPNVLLFNGFGSNNSTVDYAYSPSATRRVYNPNLFPVPISITSFITSNRSDNFQNVGTNSGTDSLVYLAFRYGVNNHDIEICLLTKDSNNFQINNQPLIIPYASLTFTGFNKIKRLT